MVRKQGRRGCSSGSGLNDRSVHPAGSGTPLRSLTEALSDPLFISRLAAQYRSVDSDDRYSETLLRLVQLDARGKFDAERGTPEQLAAGVLARVALEFGRRDSQLLTHCKAAPCEDSCHATGLDQMIALEREAAVRVALLHLSDAERLLVMRRFGFGPCVCGPEAMTTTERARLCRALKKLRMLLERFG